MPHIRIFWLFPTFVTLPQAPFIFFASYLILSRLIKQTRSRRLRAASHSFARKTHTISLDDVDECKAKQRRKKFINPLFLRDVLHHISESEESRMTTRILQGDTK